MRVNDPSISRLRRRIYICNPSIYKLYINPFFNKQKLVKGIKNMKKKLRKLMSILLVAAMTLGLATTAFADDEDTPDCSITIDNSIKGHTYSVYKIFDATYATTTDDDGNTSTTGVAYILYPDNPWLSIFWDGSETTEEASQYFVIQPVYKTGSDTEIDYYAVHMAKSGDDDDDDPEWDTEVVEWIRDQITVETDGDGNSLGTATLSNGKEITAVQTEVAEGGELKFEGLEPGYYFVTTTNGTTVSVTTAAPDAVIIDKNQAPGELHKSIVTVDSEGEIVEGSEREAEDDGMDEDVTFDITAYVPLYDGEKAVIEYIFEDTMSDGILIELNENQFYQGTGDDTGKYYLTDDMINEWIKLTDADGEALSITIDGVTYTDFTDMVYAYSLELHDHDTYIDETTGEAVHTFDGFTLIYYTYDKEDYDETHSGNEDPDEYDEDLSKIFEDSKYPRDAYIDIRYTAHTTSLEGYDNTNDIQMMWYLTSWKTPTPDEPDEGIGYDAHNDVYSWELELNKIDGTNVPLVGATFTLESENMQSVSVGHSYVYVKLSFDDNGDPYFENPDYDISEFESTYYYCQGDDIYTRSETSDGPYLRKLTDKVITVTEDTHYAEGTTDENGKLYFAGLGAGTYMLTEIKAPDGYNLLTDPIVFTISWSEEDGFSVAIESGLDTENEEYEMDDGYILTLDIENNSGTLLPSTGGMGTRLFYVIGAVLVLGAAVLFVTKKRLDKE